MAERLTERHIDAWDCHGQLAQSVRLVVADWRRLRRIIAAADLACGRHDFDGQPYGGAAPGERDLVLEARAIREEEGR